MIVDISGPSIPRLPRREIESFARKALRAIEKEGGAGFRPSELSIALLDDRAMAKLNARYRGKRTTTDVLTFGDEGIDALPGARPLGDVAISVDQAKRQARAEGHSLATEIRYLILHGMIHAFGWDHEGDRGEMDALEMKVRERVGLW
ncbi:MAG TPA: rRNA maturation RNase YbeY [Thermoanaerobaculia bacterium]